ncbi:MAG TPA: type I secretion system permease/ATPase [Pseudolabrys sp.]|nr:type I secretion system permease/ATPase [Pseudolabrys sp.]
MRPLGKTTPPELGAALAECRQAFWTVALFSAAVNVLMLAGPLYMLQIYDRVLSSRSAPTLVALSLALVLAYTFQAAFDLIRTRLVNRTGALIDRRLGASVHAAIIQIAIASRNSGEAQQPIRDLDQIRGFLTSTGPVAIVDMPWVPIFLALCFLIHPWLGVAALGGALLLFIFTVLTERASRVPSHDLTLQTSVRAAVAEADRRNSETVVAMGMDRALNARWVGLNNRYLAAVGRAADVVSLYGSISKAVRLLLQSSMLGIGAYLVIRQELTSGSMIAASIMMGRALAPIEVAIANWRGFVAARQSVRRLSETLTRLPRAQVGTALPKPTHRLQVDNIAVAPPGAQSLVLKQIQFELAAGEALGLIGPSGAGKTSLVRALVGIWPPMQGSVRIDGATHAQWGREALGRHIGFVSQGVELFDGTIAENIARMAESVDSEHVLAASRAAGAHDLILHLSKGYDTHIGEGGAVLSAGQRQRVALARALYGDPFMLVLDEPSSNLDNEGEIALQNAIRGAKERGALVILVAHRPSLLAACDKVLLLINGTQQAFGARDDVLRKVVPRPQPLPASPLRVVKEDPNAAGR